jgi:hypothetical protein
MAELDPAAFHGDDPEVGRQVDLLADELIMAEIERLQPLFGTPISELPPREATQRLLHCTAVLRVPADWQGWRVVKPDVVEALLLRVVAQYRADGATWPAELQLVALRSDAWLRDLAAARAQWRDACGLLGLTLEEAVSDRYGSRRWWWPFEVPAKPFCTTGGALKRPTGALPVVWLPDYDGDPDPLGLGEGWEPGQAMVVSAPLVVEAWGWREPKPRPPRPEPAPTIDAEMAEELEVPPGYVDEGLRGLEEFLDGRGFRP